jgi:hypothetical protein
MYAHHFAAAVAAGSADSGNWWMPSMESSESRASSLMKPKAELCRDPPMRRQVARNHQYTVVAG